MANNTLYIVMPAYNEEDNIIHVVEAWYQVILRVGNKSKLVVADSGSTDRTHEMLTKLQRQCKYLEIISNCEKQHGPKVLALYSYAINKKADYVFQTDSDGQTNPEEFFGFWELREKYDAIIGNRTNRGDGKIRAFVEKVVCLLLKMFYGVKVPDANAPFRLMKTDLVNKYIKKLPSDYNLPNIMLTAHFSFNNENIVFKEITFKPRKKGKNSINVRKIIKIGIKSLKDFYVFKKGF